MSLPPMCPDTYKRAASIQASRYHVSPRILGGIDCLGIRYDLWRALIELGYSGASIARAAGYDASTVNRADVRGRPVDAALVDHLRVVLAMSSTDTAATITEARKLLQRLVVMLDQIEGAAEP